MSLLDQIRNAQRDAGEAAVIAHLDSLGLSNVTDKKDPYANEAEIAALIKPDTRSPEEKHLHTMMDERGAWEQGVDSFSVLRDIALELLNEQTRTPAPVQQREAIKKLADQYARECVEFSKAIQEGAHSMSPIAVKSGDTRLALHTAIDAIATPPSAPPTDAVTVGGLHASIGILSHLVDQQRQLLVEVEDVCGRDGHGAQLEDGESDLIDRVRAQIAAVAPSNAQALECEIDSADFEDNTITLNVKSQGWKVSAGTCWLGITPTKAQHLQSAPKGGDL